MTVLDSRTGVTAASFDPANSSTYHFVTTINVYDSLGSSHSLKTFYVHTDAQKWGLYFVLNEAVLNVSELSFDASGSLDANSTTSVISVSIPVFTGATTPLAITFDPRGTTQSATGFRTIDLSQDGYNDGTVDGFSIATDGTLTARYSNGRTAIVGRLVLDN